MGKTVTQGELEVINPAYVFNTLDKIAPGEGEMSVMPLALRERH